MMLVEPVELVPADELGGVHFIAIGGAGMSGIARLMCELGLSVSGSDQQDSPVLADLRARGAEVWVGHDAAQVGPGVGTVVISSAIRETNPELAEARRRGLRVWHRSAALAALMLGKRGVAVAGTHGKTTTSAMTAVALLGAGLNPSYVVGAPLGNTGTSAALGSGEAFVVEADESDGSFLQYPATHGVVTNIEADHLDNWHTPQAYAAGYRRFAEQVRTLVVNIDDPGARELADELRTAASSGSAHRAPVQQRVITCGTDAGADVRLSDIRHNPARADGWLIGATVTTADTEVTLRLRVPGVFNLHNAVAAWTVAVDLGADPVAAAAALGDFVGTHRRFEFTGEVAGVSVYDDYAHHPTEVSATLTAACDAVAGTGRVIACFQPHLFSRTRDFAGEFGRGLRLADQVVLTEIYPAREDPIPGVTGQLIVEAVRSADPARADSVHWCADRDEVPAVVAALAEPGDLVLTLGAGDITTVAPAIVAALEQR
ncbi:UDP-N-acetylmuramate--L-alanine ligase [Enemella sp. A6]|uniref:UDP-N-acetylmuramate--L-alanine ligase n=1 Tax=Enemella sp. A6 TaxID=3440152 RepID=UPI003EB9A361